ncbi:glycosyl transferase [Rhizocola hellebori]|uniref:Glycosyl transferase n=1 Tax=Rhizocola hellebori TaxID=1392758 RepID=A0A8J3Q655_9ACTN|nr:glycosyltransferase family 2 protein [Rhizocola hellebori]GIH04545.1 glycosyl transferase [Rhizocola hellebori]
MSASRPTSLGIVVVNFWSAAEVAQLVDSIIGTDSFAGTPIAMAIVDNSDQQEELSKTAELARRHSMNCRILRGHGNIGYAAGNNLGAAWLLETGADVIWILNPDTRLVGGSLAAMAEIGGGGERVVAATCDAETSSPGLRALNLWTGRSGSVTALQPADGKRVSYVSGHSLALTRQAWIELDGLSEDYFLFYEEADLAFRSSRKGIPTTVIPGLMVKHAGGTTTGVSKDLRAKSKTAYFHASRSCLIFFRKHYRGRVPWIATMRVAYAAKVLFAGGVPSAGAILRGTLAGLRA